MPTIETRVSEKTQDGIVVSNNGESVTITNTGTGEAVNVGTYYYFRMSVPVPPGATIGVCSFMFNFSPKDAAKTQTANVSAWFGGQTVNTARWPDASPTGSVSAPGMLQNQDGSGIFPYTMSFTANEASPKTASILMTSSLQTLVNNPSWKAGNYVNVIMYCTAEGTDSDLSIQMRDNDFAEAPRLRIAYTAPAASDTRRWDVNVLLNQTFTTGINNVEANNLFSYPDNTVKEIDTTKAHSGTQSLRVTAPAQQSGRAGFNMLIATDGTRATLGESWIYCGWCWIPSYIPASQNVGPDLGFTAGSESEQTKITARDQWVPFCTEPSVYQKEDTLFANFAVRGTTPQGWQFWLDDVCLMRSNVRQMPFNGSTSVKYGMTTGWNDSPNRGVSYRVSNARNKVNGVAGTKYVKTASGIWSRADSQLIS